jgi:serine/threonine-protein kinase
VAFGLQHACELGFVHRDIKPANLLLDNVGVVKILDFGLVRSEQDAGSGLTRQLDNKSILGTADYVAPEQAVDSSGVDIRADIYALGATFYFMLTGRPLFPEGRTAQKLVWQQIKDPVPVDRLRPEIVPGLAKVVHRMLQKRPADRFQTPAEVFDALADYVSDRVPAPDPSWLPEPTARVSHSRAAVPGTNSPRTSGSTSQIIAAAMRTGSGPTSASAQFRNVDSKSGDTASDSDKLKVTPSRLAEQPASTSTHAIAAEETQRSTKPNSPSRLTRSARDTSPSNPRFVVVALTIALVLALVGIAVLLLRK